ncbi:MAG: ribonuclease P protein component [Burkholderiaceae bacterium]
MKATARVRWPAAARLKSPAEFEAVAAAGRDEGFRAARRWLALSSRWRAAESGGVRFGLTVGKRNARRAVDRTTVKRILREACRHARAELEAAAAARAVDVVLRLKSPLPQRDALSLAQLKRALRAEADALLADLTRRLAQSLRLSE